jgi:hypothetical protein
MPRNNNRGGRNNNPTGRNQYSSGVMDMARERPFAAAAVTSSNWTTTPGVPGRCGHDRDQAASSAVAVRSAQCVKCVLSNGCSPRGGYQLPLSRS